MRRCSRISLWVGMVVAMAWFCGAPALRSAEGETWATPESKTKEIKLTLKSGEVIQGKWSADTKDKVMLSVITPKGRNSQTINKEDVAKHEWVKPLEDEIAEKLAAWPADKFADEMVYAQEVIDKGYKKIVFDYMRGRQKDLTAEQFKLYGFLLLNNEMVTEAKDLITWAKTEHNDWDEQVAEVSGRISKGPKLSTDTVEKTEKDANKPALAAGMLQIVGNQPDNKELPDWVADARLHVTGSVISFKFNHLDNLGVQEPSTLVLAVDVVWDKVPGSPRQAKHTLAMVYTRKAPHIWSYQDQYVIRWTGFPAPTN